MEEEIRPRKKQRTSSSCEGHIENALDFVLNKRPEFFDLTSFFAIRQLSWRHLQWTRHSRVYVTLFMRERLSFLPTFTRVGPFTHYQFISSLTESTVKLDLVLIGQPGRSMNVHSICLWQAFPSVWPMELKNQEKALVKKGCQKIHSWPFDRDEEACLELEPLWKRMTAHQMDLLCWSGHLALMPRYSDVIYYGFEDQELVYLNLQVCFQIEEPQDRFL